MINKLLNTLFSFYYFYIQNESKGKKGIFKLTKSFQKT